MPGCDIKSQGRRGLVCHCCSLTMNCHFRWSSSGGNDGFEAFTKLLFDFCMRCEAAQQQQKKSTNRCSSFDDHIFGKYMLQPTWSRLKRSLSLPFPNEVMKQQVYTAGGAWVDGPAERSRDTARTRDETPGLRHKGDPRSHSRWHSATLPCLLLLRHHDHHHRRPSAWWVWQNNSPPTTTSKRGNPRAQPSSLHRGVTPQTGEPRVTAGHPSINNPPPLTKKPQWHVILFL